LVADVSRMYRAIALTEANKDLHRFVWRSSSEDTLKDYRMTRVTFGVSAPSLPICASYEMPWISPQSILLLPKLWRTHST
jgi:hypothetical protein